MIKDEMLKTEGFEWGIQVGFHAVPSMRQVSLSVKLSVNPAAEARLASKNSASTCHLDGLCLALPKSQETLHLVPSHARLLPTTGQCHPVPRQASEQ